MGASSSAINPTQDFLARMGDGRLFEVGASAVKYGTCMHLQEVPNLLFLVAAMVLVSGGDSGVIADP